MALYSPTGFNLLLCHYALGDKEKMKKTFQKLLTVSLGFDDEDKYTLTGVRKHWDLRNENGFMQTPIIWLKRQKEHRIKTRWVKIEA